MLKPSGHIQCTDNDVYRQNCARLNSGNSTGQSHVHVVSHNILSEENCHPTAWTCATPIAAAHMSTDRAFRGSGIISHTGHMHLCPLLTRSCAPQDTIPLQHAFARGTGNLGPCKFVTDQAHGKVRERGNALVSSVVCAEVDADNMLQLILGAPALADAVGEHHGRTPHAEQRVGDQHRPIVAQVPVLQHPIPSRLET